MTKIDSISTTNPGKISSELSSAAEKSQFSSEPDILQNIRKYNSIRETKITF